MLEEANFLRAAVAGATFEAAHMSKARLTEVNGSNSSFHNAHLIEADFSHADLGDAVFADADLTKATFAQAKARGANFRQAKLLEANFKGADLRGSFFQEADLTGANFDNALVYEIDLLFTRGLGTVKCLKFARLTIQKTASRSPQWNCPNGI